MSINRIVMAIDKSRYVNNQNKINTLLWVILKMDISTKLEQHKVLGQNRNLLVGITQKKVKQIFLFKFLQFCFVKICYNICNIDFFGPVTLPDFFVPILKQLRPLKIFFLKKASCQ